MQKGLLSGVARGVDGEGSAEIDGTAVQEQVGHAAVPVGGNTHRRTPRSLVIDERAARLCALVSPERRPGVGLAPGGIVRMNDVAPKTIEANPAAPKQVGGSKRIVG